MSRRTPSGNSLRSWRDDPTQVTGRACLTRSIVYDYTSFVITGRWQEEVRRPVLVVVEHVDPRSIRKSRAVEASGRIRGRQAVGGFVNELPIPFVDEQLHEPPGKIRVLRPD